LIPFLFFITRANYKPYYLKDKKQFDVSLIAFVTNYVATKFSQAICLYKLFEHKLNGYAKCR